MSRNIQTSIKGLSGLDDETRIKGLENLVRSLNRALWIKNRGGLGKRVIEFLEDKKDWCNTRQISDEQGGTSSSVAKIMRELVEAGLVERQNYNATKIPYPANWGERGDYSKRQWRKRNGMPHWFQRQYEYRVHGLRGKAND